MKFIVQPYFGGSSRPDKSGYRRRRPARNSYIFNKFNQAVAALRRETNHARLVLQEDDGSLKTIMMFETENHGKYYTMPFSEHFTRPFTKLNNGIYLLKSLIRKTSIRRKTQK